MNKQIAEIVSSLTNTDLAIRETAHRDVGKALRARTAQFDMTEYIAGISKCLIDESQVKILSKFLAKFISVTEIENIIVLVNKEPNQKNLTQTILQEWLILKSKENPSEATKIFCSCLNISTTPKATDSLSIEYIHKILNKILNKNNSLDYWEIRNTLISIIDLSEKQRDSPILLALGISGRKFYSYTYYQMLLTLDAHYPAATLPLPSHGSPLSEGNLPRPADGREPPIKNLPLAGEAKGELDGRRSWWRR